MRDYCYEEGENVYNVILTQIIEVVLHYGAWGWEVMSMAAIKERKL